MPDSRPYDTLETEGTGEPDQQSLLADESPQNGDIRPSKHVPRRQSSISQPPPDGAPRTPRTPHRVRFEIEEEREGRMNGHALSPGGENDDDGEWTEEEDYLEAGRRSSTTGQRAPLLTDVEAPSVTAALEFNAEDHLESARPKSGMSSAFMNMANSIIGAGIIGQPYAFRQAGLTMGILLLVVLTVTVDWTIRQGSFSIPAIVVLCQLFPGNDGTLFREVRARRDICMDPLMPNLHLLTIFIQVAQFAFAFGGMLAFCIILGDTIPNVVAAMFPSLPGTPFLWLLTNRRAVIVICVLGFSYPLSLYRDIAKLAKASTLALLSMIVILFTIVTQGARIPEDLRGSLKGSLFFRDGFVQAVGVIAFAFVCHHNSLLIYGSLKRPTMDRFARVTHYSTFASMLACMMMALAGFLTFGDKTQGNILNNFPPDNLMVNIARFLFGFNMLTTLPLECFVARETILHYWFPGEPFNPHLHLIFTTSLVVTAMALSLMTCDLGAVFELIGATSACALAFILPPLCFIKLSTRSWKTIPAVLCVAFGITVFGISLLQASAKIIRNEGVTHTC
ncbi:hypothetical protein JMJ35_002901 [Cladonia borealis]|uniref:Amino acid transporter transmembrane domain-containing protein n=1 Tax=Cladonia borealis TaxID=184061 RepID=A0AA39R5T5_9LECA|nr:hypothetical protein JMJ35_002901 [Cladonia borealis]